MAKVSQGLTSALNTSTKASPLSRRTKQQGREGGGVGCQRGANVGNRAGSWKRRRKSVNAGRQQQLFVSRGEVVGVSMTKTSISIGSLLPDLPQVP